jgi:Tol biopolymer transport system component
MVSRTMLTRLENPLMNIPDAVYRTRTSRNLFVFAILLVLLTATAIIAQRRAPTAPAKINPTSDALVFGDRTWVYYLAANSSSPRKLAKGNFPALSPDKTRVAYCTPVDATKSGESVSIMLFDLASAKTSSVFQANGYLNHLRWSADGTRILFSAAYLNGKRELDFVSVDGTGKQRVIGTGEQGVADVFAPVWAPDGRSIYFQDMNNLIQAGVDGQIITRLPLGPITEEKESVTSADSFVPSPIDANLLIYTRSVPGSKLFEKSVGEPNTALFLYNLQTKTRKRLTSVDLLALDPVWSRDGAYIYFSGYHDREGRAASPFRIYRINADGTGLLEIGPGENPGT